MALDDNRKYLTLQHNEMISALFVLPFITPSVVLSWCLVIRPYLSEVTLDQSEANMQVTLSHNHS